MSSPEVAVTLIKRNQMLQEREAKYEVDITKEGIASGAVRYLDQRSLKYEATIRYRGATTAQEVAALVFSSSHSHTNPDSLIESTVDLEGEKFVIYLSLKSKNSQSSSSYSPSEPSQVPLPIGDISLLAVSNVKDLLIALKQDKRKPEEVDADEYSLMKIARSMANRFVATVFPTARNLKETAQLIRVFEFGAQQLAIVNKIIKMFSDQMPITDGVKSIKNEIKVIDRFRNIAYAHYTKEGSSGEWTVFFDKEGRETLENMLRKLVSYVTDSVKKKDDLLSIYLECLVVLVDISILMETKIVYPDASIMKDLLSHEDLQVRYLVHYYQKVETIAPSSRMNLKAYLFSKFRGIGKVELDDPRSLFQSIDAHLRQNQNDRDWFFSICLLDYLLNRSPELVVKLYHVCENQPDLIKKEIPFHDPLFVVGLVDLFTKFLRDPFLDAEVGKTVFHFLVKIYRDNNQDHQGKRLSTENQGKLFYIGSENVDEKSYERFYQALLNRLHRCKNHPLESVRSAARAVDFLKALDLKDKKTDFPNELFQFALTEEDGAWLNKLRKMEEALKKDDQLVEQQQHYLPLRATSSVASAREARDLHTSVNRFLNSEKSMLLIEGFAGSGKSFSLRMIALELCQKYFSSGQYFPVVKALSTMAFDGKSERNIMQDIIEDLDLLKNKNVVLMLDALDEMKGMNTSESPIEKLKDLLKLENYPKMKVVLTCRSEYLSEKYPKGIDDSSLEKLSILSFDEQERDAYMERYLQMQPSSKWTKEKYKEYLDGHPGVSKLAERPLITFIMMRTLESIVNVKEHKNEDKNIYLSDFINAFFCHLVGRELGKQKASIGGVKPFPRGALAYLDYAIDFARAVGRSSTTAISPDDPDPEIQKLFKPEEKTEILRRCCQVIQREGKVEFLSSELRDHFLSLSKHFVERRNLESSLLNNDYKFNF